MRLRPASRRPTGVEALTGKQTRLVPADYVATGARVAKFRGERRMRSALRFGVGTDPDFRRVLRNARKQERRT